MQNFTFATLAVKYGMSLNDLFEAVLGFVCSGELRLGEDILENTGGCSPRFYITPEGEKKLSSLLRRESDRVRKCYTVTVKYWEEDGRCVFEVKTNCDPKFLKKAAHLLKAYAVEVDQSEEDVQDASLGSSRDGVREGCVFSCRRR